jgi:hypothetical protein
MAANVPAAWGRRGFHCRSDGRKTSKSAQTFERATAPLAPSRSLAAMVDSAPQNQKKRKNEIPKLQTMIVKTQNEMVKVPTLILKVPSLILKVSSLMVQVPSLMVRVPTLILKLSTMMVKVSTMTKNLSTMALRPSRFAQKIDCLIHFVRVIQRKIISLQD